MMMRSEETGYAFNVSTIVGIRIMKWGNWTGTPEKTDKAWIVQVSDKSEPSFWYTLAHERTYDEALEIKADLARCCPQYMEDKE